MLSRCESFASELLLKFSLDCFEISAFCPALNKRFVFVAELVGRTPAQRIACVCESAAFEDNRQIAASRNVIIKLFVICFFIFLSPDFLELFLQFIYKSDARLQIRSKKITKKQVLFEY